MGINLPKFWLKLSTRFNVRIRIVDVCVCVDLINAFYLLKVVCVSIKISPSSKSIIFIGKTQMERKNIKKIIQMIKAHEHFGKTQLMFI